MTVKELIEALQDEDENRKVILQKDAEGNSHSPLHGYYLAKYSPRNTWSGDVGLETLTDEDKEQGYTDEDVIVDGESALILVPIN